jgi:hypothetical protein
LRFTGVVKELYDVIVLPGVRRPTALGFKTGEICRTLSVADGQELILPRSADDGSQRP